MTDTVVFLVKNGIGFGHIRRALVLGEALQHHTALRPVVISQAHSLDLYRTGTVPVVNFPLLHRVPSAVTEDYYLELLDELLAQLAPTVVVEDTYPDARYGAVPALRDVPRLLVMRRLDGLSLDQLRTQGGFARYSELLIAQAQADFYREGHSGDTLAAVEGSDRVRFVGNIHYIPTAADIAGARAEAGASARPLVVVNGGAGGDQMPDGYGDRLFGACAEIARKLAAEGHPARFVFVTGPYYAGRPLPESESVVVRRFDPMLPALLASADVAVIKPGNNALSETLTGTANLVLVPDVSFMEGLDEHAARIVARYGGHVVEPTTAALEPAIRHALSLPPRQERTTPDTTSVHAVLDAIRRHTNTPGLPTIRSKHLTMLVRDHEGVHEWPDHGGAMPELTTAMEPRAPDTTFAAFVDVDTPPGVSPQHIVDDGIRLLVHQGDVLGPALRRWIELDPPAPSLIAAGATGIRVREVGIAPIARRIALLLDTRAHATVIVDLRALSHADGAELLVSLQQWLSTQPVRTIDLGQIRSAKASALLGLAQ